MTSVLFTYTPSVSLRLADLNFVQSLQSKLQSMLPEVEQEEKRFHLRCVRKPADMERVDEVLHELNLKWITF